MKLDWRDSPAGVSGLGLSVLFAAMFSGARSGLVWMTGRRAELAQIPAH